MRRYCDLQKYSGVSLTVTGRLCPKTEDVSVISLTVFEIGAPIKTQGVNREDRRNFV